MWKQGNIKGYEYQVKQYDEGSVYGIDEGRISKLWISKNGKTVVNYDRGWDIEPKGTAVTAICNKLIKMYN